MLQRWLHGGHRKKKKKRALKNLERKEAMAAVSGKMRSKKKQYTRSSGRKLRRGKVAIRAEGSSSRKKGKKEGVG